MCDAHRYKQQVERCHGRNFKLEYFTLAWIRKRRSHPDSSEGSNNDVTLAVTQEGSLDEETRLCKKVSNFKKMHGENMKGE